MPAGNMDSKILQEFMEESAIPLGCKFDDFLPVVLGVRKASQIIVPAELPDAAILGATIDSRFRSKTEGKKSLGGSFADYVKSKTGKFGRNDKVKEARMKTELLRELYAEIVEGSISYNLYMDWIDRLGLQKKILESRPTIREVYIFRDPSVAVELEELQDMRKDIRWDAMRSPDLSAPVSLRAFPEENSPAFLRKIGSILGFPPCCIDRYIFDRGSGVLSPEVRAANQIIHAESPEEVDKFAYFTKDFFPCQPDCESAAEIGRVMYEKLKDFDPELAELYLQHLSDNLDLVRRYPEIIEERIRSLERQSHSEEGDHVDQKE